MASIYSNLFNVSRRNIPLPFFSSFLSDTNYLTPKGSGAIDVVRNFRWKNSSKNVEEVPSITLVEYELALGTWAANLARVMQAYQNYVKTGTVDPYIPLYNVNDRNKGTGFTYRLPYLLGNGAKMRSIDNVWGEFEAGIDNLFEMGNNSGFFGSVGKLAGYAFAGVTPKTGFEEIYEYKNTSLESITISFPLYNTVTTQDAINNYSLVSLLTYQNLKTRTSFLTFIPPKIYTVSTANCLGGVYWPVAVVSNLSIESIGTTREIRDYGPTILMPEAYKVSITLKQLVANSSNIFEGAIGGQKINVFSDINSSGAQAAIDGITSTVGGILGFNNANIGGVITGLNDAGTNANEFVRSNLPGVR